MNLPDILDQIVIDTTPPTGDKFAVIEHLLDVAMQTGKIKNRQQALQDLLERERYLSTGYENGLAVPHAKTVAVDEMVLVFGLFRDGIEFDSLDGLPTHFVFLLLSPIDTSGPHLQALALLARNFQTSEVTQKLLHTTNEAEIREIFKSFK
jgi:mannitol/fructose-specific phosphotransferase system IIA component (Ntr-type)